MKRIAILICILCLMPALGMIPAANAAQQAYTVGDADGNGIIDVRDVTLIQRILAELVSDEAGTISQRGDVDEDGLNIADATQIQRYITGYRDGNRIGTQINPEPAQQPTEEGEMPKIRV